MGKKKNSEDVLDVLNHVLMPEMEILSDQQKQNLLKKYGISEEQLPKIHSTDPAVKALKAEKGQVIKIKRKDPTGTYFYYRIVV